MSNFTNIISPQGNVLTKVGEERYLLSEKVRNYILRLEYETGTPRWLSLQKAAYKFQVSEAYARNAVTQWKSWYFANGIRHRPLELFIADKETDKNGNEASLP